MRFEPNLSILWPDFALLARPAEAARAGFGAAELWWPFDLPIPAAREVDDLVAAFGEAGIGLVLLNLDPGTDLGQHGLLSAPGEEARFRDNVDAAAAIVARLGGAIVNAHYGNIPMAAVAPGPDRARLDELVVEALAWAAPRIARAGATLVIEPLNPVDFPRYGLRRVADAVELASRATAAAGARVGVLFDVYHVQRTEGDLVERFRAHAASIAHVQVADVPGRGRPGTGEIAFERVLAAIEATGYASWVGLEHRPSADPADTFSWLPMGARGSRSTAAV